jgi:hypothetical protein
LHVQCDSADAPSMEKLFTGHRLAEPERHQYPAGHGVQVAPEYPGLHLQPQSTVEDGTYDAVAGAPVHVSHSRF